MTSLLDYGKSSRGEWRFRLLSIPVCVQPWFWVAAALSGRQDAGTALIWIAVCFISILVHEMGHAMAFRLFGIPSEAILYAWGGLTVPKRGVRGDAASVFVSLAGPAAGFVLAGIVISTVILGGGRTSLQFHYFVIPSLVAASKNFGYLEHVLVNDLLFVNIAWGLVNLLPVYPLDGGQAARALFEMKDPQEGRRRSLWLSVSVGAAMVLIGILERSFYLVALFGLLAASSAQMAEGLRGFRSKRW